MRGQLRQVIEAAERAASLTRQMLAYAGKGRFVIAPLDLGDSVREAAPLLRTSIPRYVELKLDLAEGLPAIEADAGQIQQMIIALVMNGAEAIRENEYGRVTVRTSVCEIDSNSPASSEGDAVAGTYVQLDVIDTGSGMDEATKARIFDPFFSTKFVGRGLGLAAVHGIVRGHHGAIRVYSTPGQGTKMVVLFPAAAHAPAPEPEATAASSGSMVLVVDGEPAIRSLAENVLARAGMKVLTAENEKTALELFRKEGAGISAAVVDLQTPSMAGIETCKKLREISPEFPIILTSGLDEAEVEKTCSSLRPVRFLQKPYTAQRLARAVADVLKGN